MKRALGLLALAIASFLVLLVARAALLRPQQIAVEPAPPLAFADEPAIVERFAAALRIPTVSHQDPADDDPEVFRAFREHLEKSFPSLHASLRRELVAERTLLYTWTGRDAALAPVALLAHQDVVPVEPGTEDDWEQAPFSGAVEGGFVWGRGAMDTKGTLLAICEAVDRLAHEGFQPPRTVHLAFGHDEEVGGRGARAVVERFQAAGTRLDWVLDEGGVIGTGLVPGVTRPVALIGIAEKGYATLSLTARAEGGHSSMPPPHTAIGILAAAVERLEAHPFPASLRGATRHFLASIGPEMDAATRLVVANADLLEPLLLRVLAGSPRSNATIRTTTAVTMIDGGVKENALPASARAIVNFRILPGETIESVQAYVRRVVADPRIEIALLPGASDPSPESRVESASFALVARTIRELHPDAAVAPNLVLGATDARHFRAISDDVYRFGPWRVEPDDLKRPHGTNERVSVENYLDAVRFYLGLLRNAS